jgi:hypothetical protein
MAPEKLRQRKTGGCRGYAAGIQCGHSIQGEAIMKMFQAMVCLCIVLAPYAGCCQEALSRSTIEDQTSVEVTVYNNNLGLIKDTRKVALPVGKGELRFMDVASSIMPETVQAKSVSNPDSFAILEQNYEYDLINRGKLLDKYVGRQVKIIESNYYKDRKTEVEATLLSNNQGPIFTINHEIYLGHAGEIVLPKLPENLVAKPTLTWLYENAASKPLDLEVSYLTQNINWKADYVVVVNADDTLADVSGWVSLENKSGALFKDARLKLVAGEVHRAPEPTQGMPPAAGAVMAKRAKADAFVEKAFFEYHIYDLQRKTTIKDNQTKQVSLLEAHAAGIKKELLVYGIRTYHTAKFTERKPKQPVNVYLVFRNSKENKLGMPLPAGTMRVYKQDQDGSRQFIGEDRIQHTPKDEEVRLKVGEAFDVVAERTQTDFKQISTIQYETEWEIKIRNHKDQTVTVGVVEPLPGHWEVVGKSHSYRKLDAHTIQFDVPVPKTEEVVVKYRIRVGI